jgi:fucose permease
MDPLITDPNTVHKFNLIYLTIFILGGLAILLYVGWQVIKVGKWFKDLGWSGSLDYVLPWRWWKKP